MHQTIIRNDGTLKPTLQPSFDTCSVNAAPSAETDKKLQLLHFLSVFITVVWRLLGDAGRLILHSYVSGILSSEGRVLLTAHRHVSATADHEQERGGRQEMKAQADFFWQLGKEPVWSAKSAVSNVKKWPSVDDRAEVVSLISKRAESRHQTRKRNRSERKVLREREGKNPRHADCLVPDATNSQVEGYITDKRPELLLNQAKDDTWSWHILPGRARQKDWEEEAGKRCCPEAGGGALLPPHEEAVICLYYQSSAHAPSSCGRPLHLHFTFGHIGVFGFVGCNYRRFKQLSEI